MPVDVNTFLQGTPVVPRLLQADAYTIGSGPHVSWGAKAHSVYHVTPRRGFSTFAPFVKDERIIFYGLRRIIRDLLTKPITQTEIEETEDFLATFHAGGVPFRWDRDLWQRVVDERAGIIPIQIEALPDGQVAFPGEPVMQIISMPGFGEIANYFESTLVKVWATMERVTMAKWWKYYLQTECEKLHPDWDEEQVDFAISIMCHDFGDRAGICPQESEVLGQAHLMVFPGTDTTAGAYQDFADTREPHGSSIHALAHRTVMGFKTEMEAHDALYAVGKDWTTITAHVSDTYDFFRTVEKLCERLATDPQWSKDSNVMVLRPDSGDPIACVLHILRTAKKWGVEKRVRWIQGDSMDWETMQHTIERVIEAGFSPFETGAFGVGGHLRNSIKRDHTGLSMKLAAVEDKDNGDLRPVAKRSHTPAKCSIPGQVQVLARKEHTVVPYDPENESSNRLVLWYDGIYCGANINDAFRAPCLWSNEETRHEIREGFFVREVPDEVLSPEIVALRERVFAEQDAAWENHAEVS